MISLATSSGGNSDVLGVLLCLVSAAAYSVSVILQKPLLSRLPAIQVTWIACTVGAVACLPFAGQLAGEAADAPVADLGWVVYLGVLPTAIAFTTYAYALTHMSASSLGVTTYLVPPITVLMAWLLLGGDAARAGVRRRRARPGRCLAGPPEAAPAPVSAAARTTPSVPTEAMSGH